MRELVRALGIYELQFGRWGFRVNGGFLHSFPSAEEALVAFLWMTP